MDTSTYSQNQLESIKNLRNNIYSSIYSRASNQINPIELNVPYTNTINNNTSDFTLRFAAVRYLADLFIAKYSAIISFSENARRYSLDMQYQLNDYQPTPDIENIVTNLNLSYDQFVPNMLGNQTDGSLDNNVFLSQLQNLTQECPILNYNNYITSSLGTENINNLEQPTAEFGLLMGNYMVSGMLDNVVSSTGPLSEVMIGGNIAAMSNLATVHGIEDLLVAVLNIANAFRHDNMLRNFIDPDGMQGMLEKLPELVGIAGINIYNIIEYDLFLNGTPLEECVIESYRGVPSGEDFVTSISDHVNTYGLANLQETMGDEYSEFTFNLGMQSLNGMGGYEYSNFETSFNSIVSDDYNSEIFSFFADKGINSTTDLHAFLSVNSFDDLASEFSGNELQFNASISKIGEGFLDNVGNSEITASLGVGVMDSLKSGISSGSFNFSSISGEGGILGSITSSSIMSESSGMISSLGGMVDGGLFDSQGLISGALSGLNPSEMGANLVAGLNGGVAGIMGSFDSINGMMGGITAQIGNLTGKFGASASCMMGSMPSPQLGIGAFNLGNMSNALSAGFGSLSGLGQGVLGGAGMLQNGLSSVMSGALGGSNISGMMNGVLGGGGIGDMVGGQFSAVLGDGVSSFGAALETSIGGNLTSISGMISSGSPMSGVIDGIFESQSSGLSNIGGMINNSIGGMSFGSIIESASGQTSFSGLVSGTIGETVSSSISETAGVDFNVGIDAVFSNRKIGETFDSAIGGNIGDSINSQFNNMSIGSILVQHVGEERLRNIFTQRINSGNMSGFTDELNSYLPGSGGFNATLSASSGYSTIGEIMSQKIGGTCDMNELLNLSCGGNVTDKFNESMCVDIDSHLRTVSSKLDPTNTSKSITNLPDKEKSLQNTVRL